MIGILPQATLLWAGLLGLLMALLAVRVPLRRRASNISLGDGGDPDLLGRMRAFGNFVEYVPMILVLMALVEIAGGHALAIHVAGAIMLLARIAHALSITASEMSPNQRRGRIFGSAATFAVLILISVYAVFLALTI